MKKLIYMAMTALALTSCQKDYYLDDLNAANKRISELEEQVDELGRFLTVSQNERDRLEATNIRYANEIAQLDDDIRELEFVVLDLEDQNYNLLQRIKELQDELGRIEYYAGLEYGFPVIERSNGVFARADAVVDMYYTAIHKGFTGFNEGWFFAGRMEKGSTPCWISIGITRFGDKDSNGAYYSFESMDEDHYSWRLTQPKHGQYDIVTLDFKNMKYREAVYDMATNVKVADKQTWDLHLKTNAKKCN